MLSQERQPSRFHSNSRNDPVIKNSWVSKLFLKWVFAFFERVNGLFCASTFFASLPTRPNLPQFKSPKTGDRRIYSQFMNVVRRTLKLQNCERVSRVLLSAEGFAHDWKYHWWQSRTPCFLESSLSLFLCPICQWVPADGYSSRLDF